MVFVIPFLACNCNEAGVVDEGECNVNGTCNCKPFVTLDKCSGCIDGYWNYSEANPDVCQRKSCISPAKLDVMNKIIVSGCDCGEGSVSCDANTGTCQCLSNAVEGVRCDSCQVCLNSLQHQFYVIFFSPYRKGSTTSRKVVMKIVHVILLVQPILPSAMH